MDVNKKSSSASTAADGQPASEGKRTAKAPSAWEPLWWTLARLGSLKFTVTLFASSIFLVLIGTFAQANMNMWDVIDTYFRSAYCWVTLEVFAPRSFFPELPEKGIGRALLNFSFPFFGGMSIGIGMFINLGSAYVLIIRRAVRARMQGKKLTRGHIATGLGLLGLGAFITWAVVDAGNRADGVQDEPFLSTDALMALMQWTVGVATLALSGYSAWHFKQWLEGKRKEDRLILILEGVGSAILIAATATSLGVGFDAPSLRILWQLIQATVAGGVLLAGFWCLAGRKAGVLLIHAGVALLMFSELWVSLYAVEERITMSEGKSANYAMDIRSVELAVVDREGDKDRVTVVPGSRLQQGKKISDKSLPFDIEVVKYIGNASSLVRAEEGVKNPANRGIGVHYIPEQKRESAGADASGEIDQPAVYVRLYDKKKKKPLGTHLLSTFLTFQKHVEQTEVGGEQYDLFLRFKRNYKPYRILLRDAVRKDYEGTSTPRDYASEVTVFAEDETREARIWMNNPLRYMGETMYQSGHYVEGGVEVSVLQVVTNSGWMIPYVSCMLVFVGMGFHFLLLLIGFLRRKENEAPLELSVNPWDTPIDVAEAKGFKDVEIAAPVESAGEPRSWVDWGVPVIVGCLAGVMLIGGLMKASRVETASDEFAVHTFGRLPVMNEGRVMPMDTLARTTLLQISGKATVTHGGKVKEYRDPTKQGGEEAKPSEAEWPKEAMTLSATDWMLELISNGEKAKRYRVFRIDNLDLLDNLELPRRKGYRYSLSEFEERMDVLEPALEVAFEKAEKDKSLLDTYERKLLEFSSRVQAYRKLEASFRQVEFFSDVKETLSNIKENPRAILELGQEVEVAKEQRARLERTTPPLACPSISDEGEAWLLPPAAQTENQLTRIMAFIRDEIGQDVEVDEINPFPQLMFDIIEAYREDEPAEFNTAVKTYSNTLEEYRPAAYDQNKTHLEAFVNRSKVLDYSFILYIAAFALTFGSWLVARRAMGRAALITILVAFTAHTLLLVARIYLSGRPPVTNLYSSAVFIGWGGIVFGLVMESLYRIGIGNAVAAFSGFSSAWIASFLESMGNDTMEVLQAVLDTQFWLTTHVVLVTLGYTATFVAGFLGTLFIAMGVFTPALDKDLRRAMYRMMYGTVCFAIFFSFIGTVLGGLWADDSWGRFWGWDPKENGALIIVLWNSLVLHARWGGMVKDRGFAVLCVMGNICTAWSWFGVNELGIGLHNYGFTDGVLQTLAIYGFSQLLLVGVGLLPEKYWVSVFTRQPNKTASA